MPSEIAEMVLAERGSEFLLELSESEQVYALTLAIRDLVARNRHSQFRVTRQGGGGGTEAAMRMTLGAAYWSASWQVGAVSKETRELTPSDIDWLLRDRRMRAQNVLFQIKWLGLVRELARGHHVKTLHDLERKGIDLPELEGPEEDE